MVTVADGTLLGTQEPDGRVLFRGIPFAAPPTGPRRWRPPAPAKPWRGIRDARASAPSCPQLDEGWNRANAAGSHEDCLYLEVGTPNLSPARPLPVMVWIHGGSNRSGGAQGTITSSLVSRGIVLVSIQYRLGPLGFMAHPALTAESPARASGNYGLMDQQAALRWVRRNIARFGGDPANVTIFGGSAGGQDVGLQQLSPGAKGLFDRAIEQSGTAGFGWAPRDLRQSEAIGEEIARGAGLSRATAATLRTIAVDRLLQAARGIATPAGLPDTGTVWLQTTVDGRVITEPPIQTLARGGGQRVPLIIESNTQEIDFFHDPGKRNGGWPRRWATMRRPAAIFPPPENGWRWRPIWSSPAPRRWSPICGGGRAFRYGAMTSVMPRRGVAATHSSELRYIFSRPGENGVPPDAPALQAYWVRFAQTGDPNGFGHPVWPRWDGKLAGLSFGESGTTAIIRKPSVCVHARFP
ncbi:carboxylesterase family protein [Sphingomonas sp. I4]